MKLITVFSAYFPCRGNAASIFSSPKYGLGIMIRFLFFVHHLLFGKKDNDKKAERDFTTTLRANLNNQ